MKEVIYLKIRDYLMSLIEANSANPDFKLPTESQLAIKFNASRVSVRKAFEVLESKNVIVRIQGKGSFINTGYKTDKSVPTAQNVCMIVPTLTSKFMNCLIGGVQAYCEKNSLNLFMMCSNDDNETESSLIKNCLKINAKGIVIFPSNYEYYNEEIMNLIIRKFPLVVIDRKFKGHNINFTATDHFKTTYKIVQRLHNQNYKNITLITTSENRCSSEEDRIKGFQEGIIEFYGALTASHVLNITDYVDEKITDTFEAFLATHPDTQVFIINSGIAYTKLLQVVNALKLKHINYVLFDEESNENISVMNLNPFLVIQDAHNIGLNAAKILHDQINGSNKTVNMLFPAEIIKFKKKYKLY